MRNLSDTNTQICLESKYFPQDNKEVFDLRKPKFESKNDNICNADESVLFYRICPGRTSGRNLAAAAVKNFSKDRITLLICCSVQESLQAAPHPWYEKMRAIPRITERYFGDLVGRVNNHISWKSE